MASIYSSIYGDVVADVLHQASDDGFNSSSDELDRRARAWFVPSPTAGALAAMAVGGNKLQAFELHEFAAKGKLVKVKALSKLSDAAKKAALKDTAKPKKKAAADKVAAAGLAVAWCFVISLIFFSSLHRNQQAGVSPLSEGDGAAGGGGGGISRFDFSPSTKLLGSMVGPTYQSSGPTGATCTACKSSATHATTLRVQHAGVRPGRSVWWRLRVREIFSTT